jgi:hypothetical protein
MSDEDQAEFGVKVRRDFGHQPGIVKQIRARLSGTKQLKPS